MADTYTLTAFCDGCLGVRTFISESARAYQCRQCGHLRYGAGARHGETLSWSRPPSSAGRWMEASQPTDD